MNTLQQQSERFKALPADFQRALEVFDYDHRLGLIHKKYKLHIDQSVSLEHIMSDIIFGDERTLELTSSIEQELRVSRDLAIEIALEINKNILEPIKASIRSLQNPNTDEINL